MAPGLWAASSTKFFALLGTDCSHWQLVLPSAKHLVKHTDHRHEARLRTVQ